MAENHAKHIASGRGSVGRRSKNMSFRSGTNYTNIQSEAAVALGRIQDPAAVEYFVSVLKNPDGKLRAAAAYALGNMKDARAARPLLAALKDIESDVRSKVVWALGEVLEKKEKGR